MSTSIIPRIIDTQLNDIIRDTNDIIRGASLDEITGRPDRGALDSVETPDWTKSVKSIARTVVEAMDTGLLASRDYDRLTAHGNSKQQATQMVFQKHFGKR